MEADNVVYLSPKACPSCKIYYDKVTTRCQVCNHLFDNEETGPLQEEIESDDIITTEDENDTSE